MIETRRTTSRPLSRLIESPSSGLQKQILGITTLQNTDPRDKFNTANARELYAWIVPAVLKFQGALTARYRKGLNSRGEIEVLLASPVAPHQGDEDRDCSSIENSPEAPKLPRVGLHPLTMLLSPMDASAEDYRQPLGVTPSAARRRKLGISKLWRPRFWWVWW